MADQCLMDTLISEKEKFFKSVAQAFQSVASFS